MSEPVKLSRERWAAITNHWRDLETMTGAPHVNHGSINVYEPTEIDGITFLPATYVPASPA